jgi:hypothetical protein
MSILRRALESYDGQPTGNTGHDDGSSGDKKDMIVMRGPLSQLYTDALNKVYAKENPQEGTIATESQANDALMSLAGEFATQGEDDDQTGGQTTVYGVASQGVQEQDLVDITQELAGPDKVVLIMDGVAPGPNSPEDTIPAERVEALGAAMESFVTAHGGKVFHSLEEFAESRKRR